MNQLHPARLSWLLRNELLTAWSRLLRYTIGGMVIGLLIYSAGRLVAMTSSTAAQYALSPDSFSSMLMIGGVFFTASIFSNLHRPLENIEYLMTPVSSLERFLVKYLVSGPLFVAYLLVAWLIFEILAQTLSRLMFGTVDAFPNPALSHITSPIIGYLKIHILVFAGAIFFRRYTLLKTGVTCALLLGTAAFLTVQTVRLRFSGLFENGQLVVPEDINMAMNMPFQVWHFDILWLLVSLWVLYLAYLWLVDYEV